MCVCVWFEIEFDSGKFVDLRYSKWENTFRPNSNSTYAPYTCNMFFKFRKLDKLKWIFVEMLNHTYAMPIAECEQGE